MEIGGKQGSRLTGRMFAKLMDTLAEELELTDEGFKLDNQFTIAVLLWVDDVVTCVDGIENQEKMLLRVHEFAIRHQLRWGQDKCNVMRIGKHNGESKEWKLGDMPIKETTSYKYLGDLITNDGKNTKNLEARKLKIQANPISINSMAASEILRKIEAKELHEKVNIAGLLCNAESWNLNRGEKAELERIEVQALKYLFDLPAHTPTPAIIHTLGTLYTNHRVDQKRLIYIHRILNRSSDHWTKQALRVLDEMNIGWGKSMKEALAEYDLPTDHNTINNITRRQWIKLVKEKIETKNQKNCSMIVTKSRMAFKYQREKQRTL